MKNLLIKTLMILGILIVIPINIVKAEEIGNSAFDDVNFYKCVVDAYNSKNSADKTIQDSLTDEELQTITSLHCDSYQKQDNETIKSAKGLEKLTELTSLALTYSNLSNIDVSNNTKLIELDISINDLEEIDISKNIELEKLNLEFNDLKKLDVTNNKKLKSLILRVNDLEELDVSQNTMLEQLHLQSNPIKSIDLKNNVALTLLTLGSTDIKKVDLKNNVNLEGLYLYGNELSEIEFPQNNKIEFLHLSSIKLNNFSIDKFPNLKVLILSSNILSLNLKEFNNFQRSGSIGYNVAGWSGAVSFNYSFSPQSRTFNLAKENNIYKLNLKAYDSNLDPSKVVFTPIDGVAYDNETGIFTFTKEVKNISYIYKTGLPSSTGVSEDMQVNLTLNYSQEKTPKEDIPNEEVPKEEIKQDEYADQKAESVQTGAITIGIISIVGILIGITYYLLVKKNKLYKL